MESKLFKNGTTEVINVERQQFKLYATMTGIRIVNRVNFDQQFLLPYEDFSFLVTDEEKLAEEVNKFLIEKIGKIRILLSWSFEDDRDFDELKRVMIDNHLLQCQFDSE